MQHRTLRWVAASTVERLCERLRVSADEWAVAWLGAPVACACVPHAAPELVVDLTIEAGVAQPHSMLGASGLREAVAALLFGEESGEPGPLGTQVLDDAAQALLRLLANAVLPAAGLAPVLRFDEWTVTPGDDGAVLLALELAGRRIGLSVDGASVAQYAALPPSTVLAAVAPRCFERSATQSAVALELVVGEAELSVQALQRAEVDDVILLDTPVDAPFLLHAPALGLSWRAYLGQHDGQRVVETAHDG